VKPGNDSVIPERISYLNTVLLYIHIRLYSGIIFLGWEALRIHLHSKWTCDYRHTNLSFTLTGM